MDQFSPFLISVKEGINSKDQSKNGLSD
jgi:hypothetical protein